MKKNLLLKALILGAIFFTTALIFFKLKIYASEDEVIFSKLFLLITFCLFSFLILFSKKINTLIISGAGTILVILFVFELIFGFYTLILGQGLASILYTSNDKLYIHDANLNMYFLRPNKEVTNYSNQYYWKEATDDKGFRNEKSRDKASIILLGDSFTYGFALNIESTIGYLLEELTMKSVVNLARPGDATYEQMYILDEYGLSYSPQYVLYFFFTNDVNDIYVKLNEVEIDLFLNTPNSEITFPERQLEDFHELHPYIVKYFGPIYGIISRYSAEKQLRKTFHLVENMAWEYTKKAILKMRDDSEKSGAEFYMIPIQRVSDINAIVIDELEKFAVDEEIVFIDTRETLNMEEHFLPIDGHLSELGAKALAELIAQNINSNLQEAPPVTD